MITEPVAGNGVIAGSPAPVRADAAASRPNAGQALRQSAAPTKQEAEQKQEEAFDLKSVEDATRRVAEFVGSIRSELSFSIDQASGINVVKILDTSTKEVIRQIPSREIIQLAQALDKLQGLFVKDKA